MFACMHLWCVGASPPPGKQMKRNDFINFSKISQGCRVHLTCSNFFTYVSHLNPGVQLWEINSSIKEEEKEKGKMRGRRRQSLRRMIGAVTVRDNSTGGKKVELKAAKARWRCDSRGVMIAHLMSASVTETTWKFKTSVVMETDFCAADRQVVSVFLQWMTMATDKDVILKKIVVGRQWP